MQSLTIGEMERHTRLLRGVPNWVTLNYCLHEVHEVLEIAAELKANSREASGGAEDVKLKI